jgi:hypothetical protein
MKSISHLLRHSSIAITATPTRRCSRKSTGRWPRT